MSDIFKPSEVFRGSFTLVNPNTLQLQNADSAPTLTAERNGTIDGSFTFTVDNFATGRYRYYGTVPAYTKGDTVEIILSATVATVLDVRVIARFRVDTKVTGDLKDFDYTTQECKLISAYDPAKSAASQNSVNAIPTTPLLTGDTRLNNLNAPIGSIPTNPLLTGDSRLNYLDGSIAARATQSSVDAIASNVTSVKDAIESATYGLSAIKTTMNEVKGKTDNLPSDPADASDIAAAFATVNGYVDEIENIISTIKSQTDKLSFTGSDIKATLDGEKVVVSANEDKDNYSLVPAYDTILENIETQTDKLLFDTDSFLKSSPQKNMVMLPLLHLNVSQPEYRLKRTVNIIRNDNPSVPFYLERDCRGWNGRFAARANIDDIAYAMPVRDVRWVDAEKGFGYIDLTKTDTENDGVFFGEIELYSGENTLTVEEILRLRISKDIIRT